MNASTGLDPQIISVRKSPARRPKGDIFDHRQATSRGALLLENETPVCLAFSVGTADANEHGRARAKAGVRSDVATSGNAQAVTTVGIEIEASIGIRRRARGLLGIPDELITTNTPPAVSKLDDRAANRAFGRRVPHDTRNAGRASSRQHGGGGHEKSPTAHAAVSHRCRISAMGGQILGQCLIWWKADIQQKAEPPLPGAFRCYDVRPFAPFATVRVSDR